MMTNQELVKRYPFLSFDGTSEWTYLDDMPQGWRKAFGEQMCEEIREALIAEDYINLYEVVQVKEKYGFLHWYDTGAPEEVHNIIKKYEDISAKTCIVCGEPATRLSTGWICPYCDECIGNYESVDINAGIL